MGQASGGGEWKSRYESLEQTHQGLRTQLLRQEQVTSEVKQEATGHLQQMKALSERSHQSLEREEQLVHQVHNFEKELQEWKDRYARTRAQARTLPASSMANTINVVDAGTMAQDDAFFSPEGIIKDLHFTQFQIAINELLQNARGSEPDAVLADVKSVVIAVRHITLDLGGTQTGKDEASQQTQKLKLKVSATANNLITAAKNFAVSKGLSPVSLLDAAASHVSAAVVELVRAVKVRPTPAGELDEDYENSIMAGSSADYYGISQPRASAGAESIYSSTSSAREAQVPSSNVQPAKTISNGMLSSAQYSAPTVVNGNHGPSDRRIEELKVRFLV